MVQSESGQVVPKVEVDELPSDMELDGASQTYTPYICIGLYEAQKLQNPSATAMRSPNNILGEVVNLTMKPGKMFRG